MICLSFSSELVDRKIEEFLSCFEEKIKDLSEEAFSTQVKLHLEKLFFEQHGSFTAIWRFSEQRAHLLNPAPCSVLLLFSKHPFSGQLQLSSKSKEPPC